MSIVKRGNVELTVDETKVTNYLKDGYDEIDSKGKVIQKATAGKTISIEEHNKVVKDYEAKIAKLSKKKDKEKEAE